MGLKSRSTSRTRVSKARGRGRGGRGRGSAQDIEGEDFTDDLAGIESTDTPGATSSVDLAAAPDVPAAGLAVPSIILNPAEASKSIAGHTFPFMLSEGHRLSNPSEDNKHAMEWQTLHVECALATPSEAASSSKDVNEYFGKFNVPLKGKPEVTKPK